MFSILRDRVRWNDLIKCLVARDHAKIAASTLLERLHAVFQVVHFGRQLPVPLTQLIVFGPLRRDGGLEAMYLADAVLGQPYAVLQKYHDDEQRCGKPLH